MVVGLSSGALGCAPVPTFSLYGDQGPGCADASDIACQPFGSPAAVSGLAQANNVEKPTLTSDELEVFFLSYLNDGGLGNGDVWYTTRTGVDASWAAAVPVPNVNTSWREASPAISADGNTLWLGSDRPGGLGGLDIWVSMRADAGTPWAPPVDVTELNSAADEIPRPPGASELVMMLSRRASASVPYQILAAARASLPAPWGAPASVASVDTANLDDDGYLTDDGLTLYFSSDRLSGTQDLFVTQRASGSAPFAAPLPLTALNTATYDERDPWVSADQHEIYFTSNRSGTLQIYRAVR
jgi:hypothetical protein